MHHFFSEDNPAFAALSFFADMVIVSILWLVCSLPVVTCGAASAALYYAVTKTLRHKRGYVSREFFHGMKMCLKQGIVIWLIYALFMVLLFIDISIMHASEGTAAVFLQFVFAVIMLCLTTLLVYALAYIARFTLPVRGVIRNAALMAARHLPGSLLILLVTLCAAAGIYFLPFLLVIVPAAAALLDSLILEKIFVCYMTDEDRELEEKRNNPEQYDH